MSFQEYAELDTDKVLEKLKTSDGGLSQNEVLDRLEEFGQNKITSKEVTSLQILFRQFKNPFAYLLFISFLISFWFGEKIDAFMILAFVSINTILGFYQEYKSASAVKLLKKYLVSQIRVRREGVEKNIETNLLVPGDIVFLEPGLIIPADIRFIETTNLTVDESVLTGESQPVQKFSDPVKSVKQIYDAENIGFSGTTVVGGKGLAVVFATGTNTNYAKVVELTSESERESSFEKELSRFSKFTLFVVLATLIFVVVTSIAIKPNPSFLELMLFSLALAVSVIPEALPVVTTFSLSIGAINLTKKKVVVKRLSSIEDLGALEVLASDKTGTLTENKLAIEDIYSNDINDCILKANLASGDPALSRNLQNNAFDIALKEKMIKLGQEAHLNSFEKIDEIPFDPNRRRVTTLISQDKRILLVTRGSPEEIFKICNLSKLQKEKFSNWVVEKGKEGKRVLAVAEREIEGLGVGKVKRKKITDYEENLIFLGLISFLDPIKKSAYKAIDSARKLGINVKILTGDSSYVAASVAKKVGLISDISEVITGDDFDKLTLEEKHKVVDDYQVFARVTPQQKYDIIKLLQEKYSVGFLGEGINDAPALKVANVAVVVQEASDIAREASDIVLLKKDLKVILDGIEGGRKVFENTSKYITATMASNFGNFFAVALIAPFIDFLPMLPLQILLVNLLSDFPMIMVATDNVDDEAIVVPKRYDLKNFAVSSLSFGAISTIFDFLTFATFFRMGERSLQTYWFMESIITELLFLFSIRSTKPIFFARKPSKSLVLLTFLAVFLTIFIPFTKMGRGVFGFIQPNLYSLLIVFAIVFTYLFLNEIVKFLIGGYKFYRSKEAIIK